MKHFYEFGSFRLDPAERLLLRQGEEVPLTPTFFNILLPLVENSVVERETSDGVGSQLHP